MIRTLLLWLLMAGLGLVAYDAGSRPVYGPGDRPQPRTFEGGTSWPTPSAAQPSPTP